MSYDPKTATIVDPSERLRRDITLLTPEQKAEIYDAAIKDMDDAHRPELAKLMPTQEKDEKREKAIDAADDKSKADNADFVALKLSPEDQMKLGKKVTEMLEKNEEDAKKQKAKEAGDTEDKPRHHAPAHAVHREHAKEHVGAR